MEVLGERIFGGKEDLGEKMEFLRGNCKFQELKRNFLGKSRTWEENFGNLGAVIVIFEGGMDFLGTKEYLRKKTENFGGNCNFFRGKNQDLGENNTFLF